MAGYRGGTALGLGGGGVDGGSRWLASSSHFNHLPFQATASGRSILSFTSLSENYLLYQEFLLTRLNARENHITLALHASGYCVWRVCGFGLKCLDGSRGIGHTPGVPGIQLT